MRSSRLAAQALALGLVAASVGAWRDAPAPSPSPTASPAVRHASPPPSARPVLPSPSPAAPLPFAAGERLSFRMTYAHLLAGRAAIAVDPAVEDGRPVYHLSLDVKSEGLFAWLFRYRVDDHTVATWDPATGCSLGIEKHLREGRSARDQVVRFDSVSGMATVSDAKIKQTIFAVGPCPLDVFSAFFLARERGLGPGDALTVRVFDNGRLFDLPFRPLGYEMIDLPAPLGRMRTQMVEPVVPPGSGLFTQEGRLLVWVTADARRIPVRVRSKVPVGSVSGDLESYTPPTPAK